MEFRQKKWILTELRHNFPSQITIVTKNCDRFPSQFVTDGQHSVTICEGWSPFRHKIVTESVTIFPSVTKSPLFVEFLLPKLWRIFRHNFRHNIRHNCLMSVTISVTNGLWRKKFRDNYSVTNNCDGRFSVTIVRHNYICDQCNCYGLIYVTISTFPSQFQKFSVTNCNFFRRES